MVEVAQPLAPFIRRPPTPPKESTSKLIENNALQNDLATHQLLDTPDESPSSSADYFKNTSERARKKVGFSGWTRFHRPPKTGRESYDSDDLRPLPPSRDCRSSKSILKPSAEHATIDGTNYLLTFDSSSLPAMLRSAIQHMSSNSRPSRLDAYGSLLACLSTYEDVPNAEELLEGVTVITSHIRRDVCTRSSEDGPMDIQLATQALKLITVFLCTPNLAVNVPEDFRSFIVERSFRSLEDEKSPKILVSHYMHLLERQKFGPKIMTAERADRLLSILDTITSRIKGNRIVGHRLMIYQRLLNQAKSVMASKIGSWIDHLITGLLSRIKDIRIRAISFGAEAGLQLGTTNNVSEACLNVFNRQSPEGKKVVDLLCSRLTEMMSIKDDAVHVAQIWSVVILFLRSRRQQIECWEHLKAWLIIIQRCFNSGDAQVKFQANIAWNRFIFAINIETTTSSSMAKMLKEPIVSQLERNRIDKSNEKNSKLAKQVARSSYCTLLYYALRPTATHAQLDQYWDLYVADLIPKSFTLSKNDVNHACDILAALLSNGGQHRVWDENKANMNGPLKPDELPCLDPKWVRSRAGKIMQVFDKLFTLADWQAESDPEAPMVISWRNFMAALGFAGSKEIKVSTETMTALAQVLNQVKRSLSETTDQVSPNEVFKRIHILVKEAVSKIGSLAFNEKRIVLKDQSYFEATSETPSSRSRNIQSTPNSPSIHLLDLLANSQNHHDPSGVLDLARYCIQLVLHATHSRHSRLSTLRNLARRWFAKELTPSPQPQLLLWQAIAEYASSALRLSRTADSHEASPQSSGHEYRDAVKILEIGVRQHSTDDFSVWQCLFDQIVETIDREIGPAGTVIMVAEPLAAVLHKEVESQRNEISINAAVKVLEKVSWQQSRQLLERAQFQLWGTVQRGQRPMASEPFEHFYPLLDAVLVGAYAANDTISGDTQILVLATITSIMHACPPPSRASLLGSLQHGLAAWIEDPNGALVGPKHNIYPQVKKLWALVATIIESVPDSGNELLSTIDTLVTASLRSRHSAILNDAVIVWNRTFGCAETLIYTEDLRRALIKLRAVTDIDLPSFSETDEQEAELSSFHFVATQNPEDQAYEVATTETRTSPDLKLTRIAKPLKVRALSHSPRQLGSTRSPLLSAIRSATITPRARLRHDDTQIRFAAIESSPLASCNTDSQMLTDRQKEVKERQGREAAMFPSIRSSPVVGVKASISSLPKLAFKSKQKCSAGLNPDDDISPGFPPDTMMSDFLGSSPTPSSGPNRSRDRSSDEGPPASPPFVSSYLQVSRGSPSLVQNSTESPFHVALRSGEQHRVSTPTGEQTGSSLDEPRGREGGGQQRVRPDMNMLSDLDVYVDAPSEPLLASSSNPVEAQVDKAPPPRNNRDTNSALNGPGTIKMPKDALHLQESPQSSKEPEVSRVMDSFRSVACPCVPTEDDQAAAQLLAEMEGAQSRQPSSLGADPGDAQISRKRKRPRKNTPRKRARMSIASQDRPNVMKAPMAGEVVADCVLIDARPATGILRPASPETVIKKERSASPPAASVVRTIEETPIPSGRRSARAQQLAASRQSSQALRRRAREAQSKAEMEDDANAPHSIPKRKVLRSTIFSDASSVPLDTSSDPLHADDSPLQISMSSSAINVSVPEGDNVASAAPLPDIQPGEALDETTMRNLQPAVRPERPTPQSILQGLRSIFDSIKQVTLRPEEERAMVSVLFESVQQVHEAGRRHSNA
ncbi:MAG: hypothetical protein Q9217_003691 [Psora testacea]